MPMPGVTVRDIYRLLDSLAPFVLQEDWDNSGLQAGSFSAPVGGVLVCLDVTAEAVKAAVSQKADLIVSHHPLFFRPLKRIDLSDESVRLLLANGISVIASHTPADLVSSGTSFALAARIGLTDLRCLAPLEKRLYCKLVTFVPPGGESKLLDAVFGPGAGEYGLYERCAFASAGRGRFRKKAGAKPRVKNGKPFSEIRLELIVRRDKLHEAVANLKRAHPYEEAAIDVFEEALNPVVYGYGCTGRFRKPQKLSAALDGIKEKLALSTVKYKGDLNAKITTVALCGGSGAGFIGEAIRSGAELYVTGDLKYHESLDAYSRISLADVGHRASELPVVDVLYDSIRQHCPEVRVFKYSENNDFFEFR